MSLLSDYHGPRTRSRALSIHQTSVYLGTAGGAVLAGYLGERTGLAIAVLDPGPGRDGLCRVTGILAGRAGSRVDASTKANAMHQATTVARDSPPADSDSLRQEGCGGSSRNPAGGLASAGICRGEFRGGHISDVAADRTSSSGSIWGSIELVVHVDILAARQPAGRDCWGGGGRLVVAAVAGRPDQGAELGLIVAAPFVFLTGWSTSVPVLIAGLIGAGICKGVYDSNIFASLFDVIAPEDRGTAAGLMNTVGWTGGSWRRPWSASRRIVWPGRHDRVDGGRLFAGRVARAPGGSTGGSPAPRRALKSLVRHQEARTVESTAVSKPNDGAGYGWAGAATSTPSSG